MLKKIINYCLPNHCLLCQANAKRSIPLCHDCEKELPWNQQACHHCGKHLKNTSASTCGLCLAHPPPFHQTIAAFQYTQPIDQWITAMKFHEKLHYTKVLGQLLANQILESTKPHDRPQLIIPVPLHHKRLQTRGFNQAIEIAKPISKALNIPMDIHSCQRIKNTLAQSELSAKKRIDNIRNAFKITSDIHASHIAIVDDVITTGNTITEFTKALQQQGVERIDIWATSRAQ